MNTVAGLGEVVARRTMDRRRFLARASATAFGVVAALAVEGFAAPTALASAADACANHENACGCNPCGGLYCTTRNSAYCSGAACAGGCTYRGACKYNTSPGYGCWCTNNCIYGGCTGYGGYYKCCDCTCPGGLVCSCRQFIKTCGKPLGICC